MEPIKVNDPIYDPYHGKGLVSKVFSEQDIIHVDYKMRDVIYMSTATISKTENGWHVADAAIGSNKVEGHIEIFSYRHKNNKIVSLTKPFYTTPAGRLMFSHWRVLRNGLNKASLNTVHCLPALTLLYVLQNDPNKERHKALFWRTIARQLMKKAK